MPPAVVATATPTPLLYGVCQLAVNGHNARVTVGGDGVSSAVCSSLLALLGSQLGWSLSTAPPPTVPTSDVICAIPASLLPKADQGVVTDSGAFGTTDGSAACTALAQASVAGPCPSPITGVISGAGTASRLRSRSPGPRARSPRTPSWTPAGWTSTSRTAICGARGSAQRGRPPQVSAGWSGTVNEYSLPASALLVLDGEAYVPIATGTLVVFGAPSVAFSGGIEPLIGPNVLQQGAELSSSGSQWALTPPCSA